MTINPLLMPALSPTMVEGILAKWIKKEGDLLKPGEVIAEIETDKATMEIEAVEDGVLGKILIPAGTEGVKVNQVIAFIVEEGVDPTTIQYPIPNSEMSVSALPIKEIVMTVVPDGLENQEDQPISLFDRILVTPIAKRMAAEKGLDLKSIAGSGPKGRIIKSDIEKINLIAGSALSGSEALLATLSSYQDIPLNNMRKVIAKRLTEAKQTIPHFYLRIDCYLDELLALRSKLNSRDDGFKLSVNDFIVKACAVSLKSVPATNVTFHDTFVRHYQDVDLCVAVAVDGGLVTPIVRQCDQKSLRQISHEVKNLADKARKGQLTPEQYQGGSFTVSNLGMYGINSFDAIINPPQACILAVGLGEKKAVVDANQIQIKTVMNCTLSIDHRALDGAVGSAFLKQFKEHIEDPYSLLM